MEIPRSIGKYEILERIGKGGFGVVYKGRDPFIKRLVAVKVCTSADETLRRRFLREAEIAGNLHHRNIVTVFEFGYEDAGPFLVQEYLEGEDLEAKIRRAEPLPEHVRLGYLLQIARALEYAHKKGILHRDVKPANVRVLQDDRIKILDFGIAKLSGAETQLTRSGRILGTAGYLSPEQIKGEAVAARSDVFSFGVLAYELLSYVHPFPGTTISELLHQVVRSEPRPLASVYPACPADVAAMVTRCLEKDPARRYEDFPEVAETLGAVLARRRPAAAEPGEETGGGEPAGNVEDEGAEATGERGTGAPEAPPPTLVRPALQPPGAPVPGPASIPRASPEETLLASGATVAAPEERDLEATQEIPISPFRRSPRTRQWTVAAAVLAGCVLLALGAAWLGWLRLAAPEAPRPAPVTEEAPTVAGPQGRLLVNAVPWGEVSRVLDAEGREMPLPDDRSTPLAVSLPAGRYTAEIAHPEAEDAATCQAEVAAGGTSRCTAELHRLEPLDYFREAGWWR